MLQLIVWKGRCLLLPSGMPGKTYIGKNEKGKISHSLMAEICRTNIIHEIYKPEILKIKFLLAVRLASISE